MGQMNLRSEKSPHETNLLLLVKRTTYLPQFHLLIRQIWSLDWGHRQIYQCSFLPIPNQLSCPLNHNYQMRGWGFRQKARGVQEILKALPDRLCSLKQRLFWPIAHRCKLFLRSTLHQNHRHKSILKLVLSH